MYSRKWTRMSWWHSMKYLKKYGLIETPFEYPIFHQFPPTSQFEGSLTKSDNDSNKDYDLIGKLLNKYPELRHIPLNRDIKNPGTTIPDTNYIFNFVKKQKSLMKQGFSEEKAFDITEKLYQQRMQRKIDQNRVARGLAINNRARSFMNIYQQQSEYEARLKVLRLERDISKYEQARVDFKKKLDEWQEEDEESLTKTQEDQDAQEILQIQRENEEAESADIEKEGRGRYTRVLERIVTSSSEAQPPSNQKEIIQQFIDRTKNLFNSYYDRASMLDKLSGLTDPEIKSQIRDTPSKLKKRTRLLRNKLEKNGIKLTENGEVDFSQCDNANVLRKLKGDPMVKIALMSSDLHFEFPHQEEEIKKALDLRNRHEELDEENVEDTRDTKAKQEGPDDFIGEEKLETLSKEEEKKYKEEILEKRYADGKIYYPKEQTFRLIETYSERMKRLEKKWLQAQIARLEAPAEEALKQKEERLKTVVNDFRRLKFKLEQEASQSAERLLFSEHEVFTQEELAADKDFPFEKLESYLNLPQNLKRLTQKQEFEDKLIMKMITPNEIEEDLVPVGFEDDYKRKLYPRDSSDYKDILIAKQREEERIRDYQINARSEFKGIDTHEDLEEEDKLAVNEEKKGKDEKKKIVDFIKKAALKKASDIKKDEKAGAKDAGGKKDKKELGQEVLKGAAGKKKK